MCLGRKAAGVGVLFSFVPRSLVCSLTPPSLNTNSGFPPALESLKTAINDAHPGLPRENPGARWPKTTLACLKDGARLTPDQLETLNALCKAESAAFHYEGDRATLAVTHATVAVFGCRSLERLVSARDVPFSQTVDDSPPTADAAARVDAIVAEPDAPDYWYAASRDGHREAHYRGDAIGATLVIRHRHRDASHTDDPIGLARLQRIIADFQARVDAELPGMYAWFDPASRHVTVRGLVG